MIWVIIICGFVQSGSGLRARANLSGNNNFKTVCLQILSSCTSSTILLCTKYCDPNESRRKSDQVFEDYSFVFLYKNCTEAVDFKFILHSRNVPMCVHLTKQNILNKTRTDIWLAANFQMVEAFWWDVVPFIVDWMLVISFELIIWLNKSDVTPEYWSKQPNLSRTPRDLFSNNFPVTCE